MKEFFKSIDFVIFIIFGKFVGFERLCRIRGFFGYNRSMVNSFSSKKQIPEDPILTTRDAAQRLGVSVSTAQLWMESGALPSWKTPGGHRRCRLSNVERLQKTGPGRSGKQTATTLADEFIKPPVASYPMLDSEQQRLIALADSGLMDSPPDAMLDRLTWLASRITGCPTALVSLLTSERQWFKSRVGLDVSQTPREAAFCSHAIMAPEGMVVEDAQADSRFADNPLVVGAPFIRFYAGVPITDAESNRLGTLCVLDSKPHQLSADQLRGLVELAAMVTAEISR